MSSIPSHYSDRYINQRYNKALYIVQHLPTSSNVQPTKDQKLELYALYKQVSQGDVDTQRPGIFDVVGRAKWDAWKNIEGMGEMEAKHRYVETLLRVATEAYKKPAGRAQAHQIIQSFAIMQPSGDSGDSSSEEEETSELEDDSSVDAEELAYLREVQKATPSLSRSSDTPQRRPISRQQQQQKMRHWHDRSSSRASSQSGHMSMMTAPSELRRLSQTSQSSNIRPLSVASGRSTMGLDMNMSIHRKNLNRGRELYDDHFDDSVNPWSLHPSARQYKAEEPSLPSGRSSQQDMSTLYRSPLSTSSSVTATQQYANEHRLGRVTAEQTVLGPATKRALEALQREIEALNERIDGLRKELVDRDQSKRSDIVKKASSTAADDDEGWKWVFKAAVKHALMNLMTASVLLLVLYKKESPVAYAILGLIQRFLHKFKVAWLIQTKKQ